MQDDMPLNLERLKAKLDAIPQMSPEERIRLKKEEANEIQWRWLEWEREVDADNIERDLIENGRLL